MNKSKLIGRVAQLALILIVLSAAFAILSKFVSNPFSSLFSKLNSTPPSKGINRVLISPAFQKDIVSIKEAKNGSLLYYLKDDTKLYPAMGGSVSQGGGVYSKYKQSFNLLWITYSTGEKLEYKYIGDLIEFKEKVSNQSTSPIIQLKNSKFEAIENASLVLTLYDITGKIKKLSVNDFESRK